MDQNYTLRKLRCDRGFSQEFVAGSCCLSRMQYSSIEAGRVQPKQMRMQTVDLMAVFFKMSLDDMYHLLTYNYYHHD